MRRAQALLLAAPQVVAFRIPEQASRSNEGDSSGGRQLGEAVCNAYIYDTGLFDKGVPHGTSCDESCDGSCDSGCDICDTRPGALIRICNRGCDEDCDTCDTGCDVCPYMPPAPPPPPPSPPPVECKTWCIVAQIFVAAVIIAILCVIIYLFYLCCCKPKTTETTTETLNADGSVTRTTTKTTEPQDTVVYDSGYAYDYGPTYHPVGPVLTFDGSDGFELFTKSADQANNVSQMPLLGMAQAPQKGT